MIKTYKLAIESERGLKALPFGPFTLAQAEFWRDAMAQAGKPVHVINIHAV